MTLYDQKNVKRISRSSRRQEAHTSPIARFWCYSVLFGAIWRSLVLKLFCGNRPICIAILLLTGPLHALERLPYNNPGLVVDLGVGLWAWITT